MAQGKLKVKTNSKPPAKKKTNHKKDHGVKKGKRVFAPKKQVLQQVSKFKKSIQKEINANIEAEVKQKAQRLEEGKPFYTINKEGPSSSKQ